MNIIEKLNQPLKIPKKLKLTKLGYKMKYWVGVGIVIIVVTATTKSYLLPQWKTYQSLQNRYETLSLTRDDVLNKKEWLDNLKTEHADLKNEIASGLDEKYVHYTGVILSHIAKNKQLYVLRLVPIAERPFDGYIEVPLQLVIQGTYSDIAQFNRSLKKLDHRAELRNIRIYPSLRPSENNERVTSGIEKDDKEKVSGITERGMLFDWSSEGGSDIEIDQPKRILFLDDITIKPNYQTRLIEMECEIVFLRTGNKLPPEIIDTHNTVGKTDPTSPPLHIEPKKEDTGNKSNSKQETKPPIDNTQPGQPSNGNVPLEQQNTPTPPPLPPGYGYVK